MAFVNPRSARVVGVLHVVRCERVTVLGSGRTSTQSWPISCVVTASSADATASGDAVEIRIDSLLADQFAAELDTWNERTIAVEGIRWTQRDDDVRRRHLIDVMFNPIISIQTSEQTAPGDVRHSR
jgi:hypothetical protein